MKVLFLDQSSELQQKWIEPLRNEGWGVLRASSMQDAAQMMMLHGDAIEAIAVGENFVSFAEKWEKPFVVLTRNWSENDILKHQNGARTAVAYLKFNASTGELKRAFEARARLKSTGTDGQVTSSLSLEDFSGVMARPEKTSPELIESSIRLEAPSVLLGGKKSDTKLHLVPAAAPDATEINIKLEPESPEAKITEKNTEPKTTEPSSTVVLEQTRLESAGDALEIGIMNESAEESLEHASEEVEEILHSYEQAQPSNVLMPPPVPQHIREASGVPGDVETLKNYLALREQDVAVLSGQLRSSQDYIQQLEQQIRSERAKNNELQQAVQKHEQTIKNYGLEKNVELEVLYKQVEDLNAQLQERTTKARTIEAKLKFTTEEVDKVKDRVRVDIRRIRVREKELENQLEILKKDSAALLMARDEKILDLKRKLDLIEFNMELVQEQYSKERNASEELRNRLKDAAQAMRQAGGYLNCDS